ncbi:MAG: sulfotransferase [Actinomycetota bacterium]
MTVLVLGSPKSGTSVTAGIVNRLGISMGPDLRLPDARNPRGYFEDVAWNALHDDMLAAAGGGPWQLPDADALDAVAPGFAERIEALVAERPVDTEWGVKVGPSVLRHVIPFVPAPRLVLVARNPLQTARSAMHHTESRADRLDLPAALAHGAQTYAQCLDAIASTPEAPLHVFAYETLLAEPDEQVAALSSFLGSGDDDARADAAALVASSSQIRSEKASAKVSAERRGSAARVARRGRAAVRRLMPA